MAEGKHARPGRHKKKRPLIQRLAPLALTLLVGAGVFYFMAPESVSPAIRSEQVEQASPVIEEPGLLAARAATFEDTPESLCQPFVDVEVQCIAVFEINETVPVGAVVSQSPAPGEPANSVKVVYSKGPSIVTVPILAGFDRKEVAKVVWESGLTLGTVNKKTAAAPPGVIVSSSLAPSSQVANGAVINLRFSSGFVKVPDWTGKTKEFVVAEAREFGLTVRFMEKNSKKTPGTVIAQSKKSGKIVFSKEIVITLAKGAVTEEVELPDVVGMKQDEAISLLASLGFIKITTVPTGADTKTPVVISMSPAAESPTDPAREIVLTVGKQ